MEKLLIYRYWDHLTYGIQQPKQMKRRGQWKMQNAMLCIPHTLGRSPPLVNIVLRDATPGRTCEKLG